MALNDEQIDILSAQYVTDLYDQMEQEVINDIARRIRKTERITETAEIMARNLREQGYNTGRILAEVRQHLNSDPEYIATVAQNTKEYKEMVRELIAETEAQALEEGNMLMAQAGDMAFNYDLQMWKAHDVELKPDSTLTQLKAAFSKQTENQLKNITRSTGSLYINGVPILDEYQRQMDLAVIKMCAGGFSYNQAVKDCVKNLAKSGVNVQYPSGRNYNITSAARMIVRTASSQLAGRVSEANMKKTGQDLVYVSGHAGARPSHAVWQGKVYVYNRQNAAKYPQYEDFYSATDYGSVTGLKGVNCSHNFYPYWPGDPIPSFEEPAPTTINGKEYTYYEATQEQRKMERSIRETKRELEGLKAIGATKDEIAPITAKLSDQVQNYKAFSYAANIRPKTERLAVEPTKQGIPATMGEPARSKIDKKVQKEIIKEAIAMDKPVFDEKLRRAYDIGKHTPPTGYYDVVGHGTPNSIAYFGTKMDHLTLAKILRGRDDYKDGMNIRLLSCDTGIQDEDGNCIAQRLANTLNCEVMAPRALLNINYNGTLTLQLPDGEINGGNELLDVFRPIYK